MSTKKSCLIIDDDPDDQDIFRLCIRDIDPDMECNALGDSVAAVSMLSEGSFALPDFIFLDVNMPKLNGVECLKTLKDKGAVEKTRIYMYSTTSEAAMVAQCNELGASGFIVKPASPLELRQILNSILNSANSSLENTTQ